MLNKRDEVRGSDADHSSLVSPERAWAGFQTPVWKACSSELFTLATDYSGRPLAAFPRYLCAQSEEPASKRCVIQLEKIVIP